MDDLLKLARPEILNLVPYSSARREYGGSGVFLNANENPYPKSSQQFIHRYPQPQPEKLRALLANLYQVKSDQLLMTRGSDEGIDLWLRSFCTAGKDAIIVCPPTYDMYSISAKIQHASTIAVPLTQSFELDLQGILDAWQPHCKLIFLCSPNNPTGNVYPAQDVLYLCEQLKNKAIIIVDEAYIEFSDKTSMVNHLAIHENLVVLRTLSKAFGMAGARCGVVLAHPQLIKLLEKVISPYPIATPIVDIILQELKPEHLVTIRNQIQKLKTERENLIQFLNQQPYVEKVWPSEANFVLLKVKDAQRLMTYCLDNNLIIRDRSHMLNLENCIRISIGTPDENQHLYTLLERYE